MRDACFRRSRQAIGYKEFFPYFEGEQSLDACLDRLKQASRNYAKRQLTWFRHQQDAVWLYVDETEAGSAEDRAEALIRTFLEHQ